MKILYIGSKSGTSKHRADALKRLDNEITHLDPHSLLSVNPWINRWNYNTGALLTNKLVENKIFNHRLVENSKFDFVLINNPKLINQRLIEFFKSNFGKVACYINDDPFRKNLHRKIIWRQFLKSIPYYDLIAVVREVNVKEAYELGAKDVLRLYMSADEIVHQQRTLNEKEKEQWDSDVIFIGTGMEERGPFLAKLIELGVPLKIYGNQWKKQKKWNAIKNHLHSHAIYDEDYAKAIQCSKICIGMLSKGNRDLHTRRSVEIPSLGTVLCAERTPEHMQMYEENKEAVYWSTPEECAAICLELLKNREKRETIARNGRERSIQNGYFNEKVMGHIIRRALQK